MTIDLIDIGANLTHDSFDEDRDAVISRAADVGVRRMILTGSSAADSEDAARMAGSRPGVFYATAGVHPHHASEYSDAVHDKLRSLAAQQPVVAIGECGLDFFRNFSPQDKQRDAFRRQIELAVETQLPLFLHQRDAHQDFLEILGPLMPDVSRAVAHCFTGGIDELSAYLQLGLYIGITGWVCDERRGQALREAVPEIPLDRLMIETDAPYLLPRTLDPKPATRRNEPMYLREVLKVLAAELQISEEELARATSENAERFFTI
ncbi:MAG: TatD family hydrolase [Woeseiaceae bacterium]|nr:TatD family hydrolase [Woeseiaceae bacterium]